MPIIKKQWHKTQLIIDLRPIQSFKYNGVTVAGKNWIESIIKKSKQDQPIILWTNHKYDIQLPKNWLTKKNIQHIHTKHSNLKLLVQWYFKIGPSISKILNNTAQYIYFCPDIRSAKHSHLCLKNTVFFHDIAFKKHSKTLSLKSKIWFHLNNPLNLYKTAHQIITNSKFSKTELLNQFGNTKNPIRIIHPSVPQTLPAKKIKTPENYYLTISTLQKRKQLKELIKLFQNKPENLVIIGQAYNTFAKLKLKKQPNIHILQNINHAQKHYLIQNSIATIYPSKYEGFGIPILESIRLRKPCYTHIIEPYKSLFKNQITNIQYLFKKQKPTPSKKDRIYNLKHESKKLKNIIYQLD